MIVEAWAACRRVGSHFVFRMPRNIKQVPVLRVKFGVVLAIVRSLWFFLGPCEDLLTARQKDHIVRRGEALMRRCVTATRRSRTNPRAVRQPVRSGPGSWRRTPLKGPWRSQLFDDVSTEFPNGISK